MQKLKEKLKDKTAFQVKKLSFFLSGEKKQQKWPFLYKSTPFSYKSEPPELAFNHSFVLTR